ncbi:MAG: hypothetical protein ABIT68_10370 [Sphingomicrobium sp.]
MTIQQPAFATPREISRTRRLAIAALLIAILLLTIKFALFLGGGAQTILYPFGIDYGEGIVWQQALRIAAGNAYGSIAQYPAIVFHYPPVFHVLSTATATIFGADQLVAGRTISFLSTLLIGGFAGLIVFRCVREEAGAPAAAICALISSLVLLTMWPVMSRAPLMRVDMTAMAFSFGGVLLGIAALRRPILIHAAALCFVAAVFTKQTSVAAPAATFLTLWLVEPKRARAGLVTTVMGGLAGLGALIWSTDGGFIRHVFLYNVNRFEAWRLQWIATALAVHCLYFWVAGVGAWRRIRDRWPAYRGASLAGIRAQRRAAPADAAWLLILIYFTLATAMSLMIAKSGSSLNYLIEWMCVLAVMVGLTMRDAASTAIGPPATAARLQSVDVLLTAILPAAVAMQALILPAMPDVTTRASIADIRKLVEVVRVAERPVISDDMVILLRAGKGVEWEPAIFAELASKGMWDERPFVRLIEEHHFAFFITEGDRGDALFDSRYTPAVAGAIASAYPVERHLAGYTLHLPAAGR